MKILHVIASMDPRSGGPCQGVRNLNQCAQEQGNSVEVVCLDNPKADYLSKENLHIHALGQGRGAWSYHPALRPWLEKNLPRFDGVVLNGLWQYPGYVMSRLSQHSNLPPYFVFPHGMLDPWFQSAPGRRLKAIRNWFYWKLIEHRVIRQAEAVFFTCAEEMRLARKTFRPYQPNHEINVGFGVTQPPAFHEGMLDAFAQKCPDLNGRPYFLFLSRIHPKKGVDLLIKAYAAIYGQRTSANDHLPQLPCLVIAGPGLETDYGKEMQKLAADLCRLNPVLWPGMLTDDAKWGAFHRTEAFVLTSHQENFGIAVVEAMACGKPVLISNQINIWREIAEDKAGLVNEDTCAGVERLFHQWENLSLADRSAMKKSARSCYENRFSIAIAAQNLQTTMEELMGRSHKPELIFRNA